MAFDPVTAAIDFGTSAVQSYGNYKTAQAINEANIQMQRETNAQNYKMFQEQNEFNRQMIAEQNAYNLPSEQVARYRAAGLNPYLMMSGGASSVQSSPAQGGNPNPMVSPKIDPSSYTASWQMLGEGIRSAIQQMYLNESVKADVEGKRIDNQTRLLKNISEISHLKSSASHNWYAGKYLDVQEELMRAQFDDLVQGQQLSNQETAARTSEIKQQVKNLVNEIAISRVRQILDVRLSKATISKINEEINEIHSKIRLNETLSSESIQRAAKTFSENVGQILQNTGIAIDNNKKAALFNLEVENLRLQNRVEYSKSLLDLGDVFHYMLPTNAKVYQNNFGFTDEYNKILDYLDILP